MMKLRSHWRSDESGAAAVLVAASLLVLMGMAAVALDGGLGLSEQRDTQNAADHAALTAAWVGCVGSTDPVVEGLASAARNGFDNNGVTNIVTLTSPSTGIWEATVVSNLDTSFGPTIGVDALAVTSTAVADCSVISGLGGFALFASGTDCGPFELTFTGSSATFEGSIHSNGRLKLNGSAAVGEETTVTGNVTYVETYDSVGVDVLGTTSQVAPLPIPGGWSMDDYDDPGEIGTTAYVASDALQYFFVPDGTAYNGVTLPNGLYYSPGSFSMHDVTAESVTLVAEGKISFTGSNTINSDGDPVTTTDGPWDPTGLGVYSEHIDDGSPCNNTAIDWSGSMHEWSGVQYAPNGKVDMSGADNSTLNGGIIAYSISLPGAGTSISYDPTFTGVEITTLSLTD